MSSKAPNLNMVKENSTSINVSNKFCRFCEEEPECDESFWQITNDSPEIIVKALKAGRLRGIACVLGCSNSAFMNSSHLTHLIQALLKRDILVTISGCSHQTAFKDGQLETENYNSVGDGLAEFCGFLEIAPVLYVGSCVDTSRITALSKTLAHYSNHKEHELPIAAVTPQLCRPHQDICGAHSHTHPKSSIKDRALAGLSEIYDTIFTFIDNPENTIENVDSHIHKKRLQLNWCDRYHCSIHS